MITKIGIFNPIKATIEALMQVKRKRKKVYFIFPISFEKTMVAAKQGI